MVVNKRKRPNCVDISALDGTGWHYMVFQVAKFKIKVGTHTDGYVSSRDISRTPLGQETEESCVAKQWEKRRWTLNVPHIWRPQHTDTHLATSVCMCDIARCCHSHSVLTGWGVFAATPFVHLMCRQWSRIHTRMHAHTQCLLNHVHWKFRQLKNCSNALWCIFGFIMTI